MAVFDFLDQQASAAVGALLNERVVWRPMVMLPQGAITGEDREPDPERPVRGDIDGDELYAVVTWKSSTMQVGQGMDTPTGVVVADCVVDFDSAVFLDAGEWNVPRKGDLFELLEEFEGPARAVQVEQRGDDGAARVLFFCSQYS